MGADSPVLKPKKQPFTIKQLFRVPYFSMGYILAWPVKKRSKFQIAVGFFHLAYSSCFTSTLLVNAYCSFVEKNVFVFADSLTTGVSQITNLIKHQTMLYLHEEFFDTFVELETAFNADFHPDAAKSVNRKAEFLYKINAVNYVTAMMCGFFYFGLPVATIGFAKMRGKPYSFRLPIASKWPWDASTTPGYQVAYLYSTYCAYCVPANWAGVENIIFDLFHYSSELFNAISFELNDISKLVRDNPQDKRRMNEEVFTRLGKIWAKHVRAIEFFRRVEELVMFLTLTQIVSASVQTCLGGFSILIAEDMIMKITYCCLFSCIFLQTSFYCFGGNTLTEANEKMAQELYFVPWYELDMRNQKTLALLICNAQQDLIPTVPFFEISLPTLVSIFNAAWSYLTILQTLME